MARYSRSIERPFLAVVLLTMTVGVLLHFMGLAPLGGLVVMMAASAFAVFPLLLSIVCVTIPEWSRRSKA